MGWRETGPNRNRSRRFSLPTRREVYRSAARARRFVLSRILHADDPPHRLALGVAIGLFVTFTPTIGFQSLLVVGLAWLLGGNKLVGLPLIWISNPATFVPIYYPSYRIGRWILGGEPAKWNWWKELAKPPEGTLEAIRFYWSRMLEIIGPLTLGCLILAVPISLASYWLTYHLVEKYRAIRERRRERLAISAEVVAAATAALAAAQATRPTIDEGDDPSEPVPSDPLRSTPPD